MFRRFVNRLNLREKFYLDPKVLLVLCIFLSLSLHSLSILNLDWLNKDQKIVETPQPVKIKFVDSSDKTQEDSLDKQILEVQQTETKPPKESSFVGVVDHQTKKQTRLRPDAPRVKGADAGQLGEGKNNLAQGKKASSQKPKNHLNDLFAKIKKQSVKKRPLDLIMPSMGGGSPTAGYFDYVMDASIEFGDVIDINTNKSMFIGYFSNIRKSIELVWVYPKEAASRNMQGSVRLQFDIQKNGAANNILVKRSSGYEILDKHVVEAVRLAEPFPPLPTAYQKNKLVVLATYHYVLQHAVAH